jgi:type I restriction-modification system DNA methylase subunit
MSYDEFRKRIDTARNILVGAVPSPAGQIDQITYALMYKFMNDIDDQSAALGGKRSYFIGDHDKYNWHNLMASSLGAHERLDLYRQAIESMGKNPNLPTLFREIYQNAFLPFNSANVLDLFLKEINKFSHGESDDIGDAYEYLLSITGVQGDVGQFRTPRHIIKFIVEAVNPTKDDTVLDPAVGTAGFLIAAYNHVRAQHDGKDDTGRVNNETHLSADEVSKLHKNYRGFDIDPTMVRTASVNMYLHGFTTPEIINHDSLSNEEYWDKRYDVILANPPFMTPKGGIKPHKKFSITANRAEVLFVDYILSHIHPVSGRAGIVVPEGVIFQSGKAYRAVRKNLVENGLLAVVSFPPGIFLPYSDVRTSVLIVDKSLTKKRSKILFLNPRNFGQSLTTRQRQTVNNDLPQCLDIIEKYKENDNVQESELAFSVDKKEILNDIDVDLSQEQYRQASFPVIEGSSFGILENRIEQSSTRVKESSFVVWSVSAQLGFIPSDEFFGTDVASENISAYKQVPPGSFAYNPARINVGSIAYNDTEETGAVSPMYVVFSISDKTINPDYLLTYLKSIAGKKEIKRLSQGTIRQQLRFKDLCKIPVLLESDQFIKPALETIEKIRLLKFEIDQYKKLIELQVGEIWRK